MSNFEFGGAFRPQVPDLPPPPSESELTLARLEILIRQLGETLARAPQPDIHVSAPDLTEMVNAVVGIKGPATAEEIAEALARRLKFPEPQGSDPVLAELADTLKTLDFRLKGAFGAAATSGAIPGDIARDTTLQRVLDRTEYPWPVTERNNLMDIKRGITDYEARLDYDADNKLIYSGKAYNGTSTTATDWTVQKLTYVGANLTRVQVLAGIAWDSRTAAGW